MINPNSPSNKQTPMTPERLQKELLEHRGLEISIEEAREFLEIDLPTQFYRIIGAKERQLLIDGQTITGQRYENNTFLDITSNPEYHNILRSGKFLVTFKELPRFQLSEYKEEGEVSVHDTDKKEYYLSNGYSLDDVKSLRPIVV